MLKIKSSLQYVEENIAAYYISWPFKYSFQLARFYVKNFQKYKFYESPHKVNLFYLLCSSFTYWFQ